MKKKNTFNNFVDFGSHVQKKKAQNIKVVFEKLSKNVFAHSLEHLTYQEMRETLPPEQTEHLDFIFENRKISYLINVRWIRITIFIETFLQQFIFTEC